MEVLIKHTLLPSSLIMFSAIAGLILLCPRFTRRWGAALCTVSFVSYLILGAGPVAFLLLGHLEYQVPSASASEREKVQTIVVLAAHAELDLDIPLSSRVSNGTAFRLLEAMSLFHAAPDSTVIVSGGGSVPIIMRDVLVSSGIPPDHVVVDAESLSTFESAKYMAGQFGALPFLLVTSAGHMPRAMGVFLKAGTNPRPVPTHYLTRRNWLAIQYLPSPVHLEYSDLAVSEYAALFWYRLRGWL